VKDNTDWYSWFSAKPIKVGNLSNIIAGTELCSQATYLQRWYPPAMLCVATATARGDK